MLKMMGLRNPRVSRTLIVLRLPHEESSKLEIMGCIGSSGVENWDVLSGLGTLTLRLLQTRNIILYNMLKLMLITIEKEFVS